MKPFFLLIAVVLSDCSVSRLQITDSRLAGMYQLLRIHKQGLSGLLAGWRVAKGGDTYILYDGKGHMMVQILPKGYQSFGWLKEEDAINTNTVKAKTGSMIINELKAAVTEFVSCRSYVADYIVNNDSSVITHYRMDSSIPSVWNTDAKRSFTFHGDTLVLSNKAALTNLIGSGRNNHPLQTVLWQQMT